MLVLYQEFEESQDKEKFLKETVTAFLASEGYAAMLEAEAYYNGRNPALDNAWKWRELQLDTGQKITFKPLVAVKSNFLRRIIDQLVNRILYNSFQFDNSDKFSGYFCETVKEMAAAACLYGVSYGLPEIVTENGREVNAVKMFTPLEYIPIVCERTGKHMAGVRFSQVKPERPMHVWLYELDGVTEWTWHEKDDVFAVQGGKVPYFQTVIDTGSFTHSLGGQNYGGFPVVPMYSNTEKTGELTEPVKSKIDLYDLVATSYGDDFVRTRPGYFRIEGFSGHIQDALEIRRSLEATGIVNIADATGNSRIGIETMELPYLAKKELQEELEMAIFRDAQVTNTQAILEGRTTATAVQHSSVAEDMKANSIEQCIARFVRQILALKGLEAGPVRFVHRRMVDDLQVMQALEAAHRMEVPAEVLIKEMPPAQGRVNEWLAALKREKEGKCEDGE